MSALTPEQLHELEDALRDVDLHIKPDALWIDLRLRVGKCPFCGHQSAVKSLYPPVKRGAIDAYCRWPTCELREFHVYRRETDNGPYWQAVDPRRAEHVLFRRPKGVSHELDPHDHVPTQKLAVERREEAMTRYGLEPVAPPPAPDTPEAHAPVEAQDINTTTKGDQPGEDIDRTTDNE